MEDAFAPSRGGESVKDRWTKEPAGECEPNGGCNAVLDKTDFGAYCWWTSSIVCEEGDGYPCPELLREVDVEWILLGREVVGGVEVVGEGGDERV